MPEARVPLSAAPGLPIDNDEPVFHAPWQAKAFALTVSLNGAGLFAWGEWAETFGAALKRIGGPTGDIRSEAYAEAYYTAWLAALEEMIGRHGVADAATLADTAETWKRAAEATPHGTPIRFEAGLRTGA